MSEHQEWVISEVPFTSRARHVGPLIVRVRTAWNSIATRWYVLPIVQQINIALAEVQRRLLDITQASAGVDRDHSAVVRHLAETQLQIARLEERLALLEGRLDALSKPTDDARGE